MMIFLMKKNLIIGEIWKNKVKKPKWLAHPNNITLSNQKGIQKYIEYLEKEIEVLSNLVKDYQLRLNTQAYALQQKMEEEQK